MASNEELMVSILSQLEATVKTTIDYVDSEIGLSVDIPTFDMTKSPGKLYSGYRETVVGYQKVCDAVATLSQTLIKLRQLRRQIDASNVLPSYKSYMKNRLEIATKDIDLCRQSALVLKDSYDSRLRFYGSTQYMLSSPRYNEVNY